MAVTLADIGNQTRTVWQSLDTGQRITIVVVVTGMFVAFVLVGMWAARPDYAPLFTNLSAEDASAVIDKLRATKMPYQISDGGRAVSVPSAKVYETRLSLASEGVPQGGGVGFELFDKTSLGATEFTQRLNYKRALQGELMRTISGMAAVESCRVHLALPERSFYTEEEQPPTASVVLRLRGRGRLTPGQVKGIVNLVAASVEGMSPTNVTVLDADSNVLAGNRGAAGEGSDSSGLGLATTAYQLELKRQFERELEKSLDTMLAAVLGPDRAVVRVSAELDLDRLERDSEIFEPASSGGAARSAGVVKSEQRLLEESKGQSPVAAGVPGTDSNVPGGAAYEATASAASASPGSESTSYTKSETTTTYEVTKRVERLVKAPGAVKRLTVAAMVDASVSPAQVESIKQVVAGAVGLNPGRGDQVLVESISFKPSTLPEEEEEPAPRGLNWVALLKTAAPALVALCGLLFGAYIVAGLKKTRPGAMSPQEAQTLLDALRAPGMAAAVAGAGAGAGAAGGGGQVAGALGPVTAGVSQAQASQAAAIAELERKSGIREQVEQMVKTSPGTAAKLLETWLTQK